jgi:LysM repeat protein
MQASDDRRNSVRAPMWAAVVAGLHVVAVGSFFFIQGCGTPKQAVVEPPPPPVMPPRQEMMTPGPLSLPSPAFQPAAEKAPASLEAAATASYTVQNGDSLSKIAAKVGVTSREIAELNNIKDANKIRVGQKLVLPSYAQSVPATASKPAAAPVKKAAPKASAPAVAGDGEYIVRSGDSLSKIAVKNGTTVKALREVNNLKSDMIRINQKLKLPAGAARKVEAAPVAPAPAPAPVREAAVPAPVVETAMAAPSPEGVAAVVATPASATVTEAVITPAATTVDALSPVEMPFQYTIKPNDTLEEVAKTFSLTSQQILDANGLTAADVSVGKKITIPTPGP